METTIPPEIELHAFRTRNTKEAALLYSFSDCPCILTADQKPYAMRVKTRSGESCFFFFKPTPLATQIRQAFDQIDYAEKNCGEIPDEYMPQVLALIVRMWHNFERCRDATKGLPLHYLNRKGNKIYISADTKGDSNGNGNGH